MRISNSTFLWGSYSHSSWWGKRSKMTFSPCQSSVRTSLLHSSHDCPLWDNYTPLCSHITWYLNREFPLFGLFLNPTQLASCIMTPWCSSATCSTPPTCLNGCASPRDTPTTTASSTGPPRLRGRASSRYPCTASSVSWLKTCQRRVLCFMYIHFSQWHHLLLWLSVNL